MSEGNREVCEAAELGPSSPMAMAGQSRLDGHGEGPHPTGPAQQFSNYICYVDESGDHGLETVDPNYPLFVLAFCVFHKRHYVQAVAPAIETFKFRHFGHDAVVLHENEIRKEKGDFKFNDRQHKHAFIDELTQIIQGSKFILLSCVIDKLKLRERSQREGNPYHLALGFCLETLYELMLEKKQELFSGAFVTGPIAGQSRCLSPLSSRTRRPTRPDCNWRIWWLARLVCPCSGPTKGIERLRFCGRSSSVAVDDATRAWDLKGAGTRFSRPQKAKSPGDLTEAMTPTGNSQSTWMPL